MATVQWLCAVKATLTNSAVRYLNVSGGHSGDNATEADIAAPVSAAGKLLAIGVKLSAAPGAGTSYQVQVSINGTPDATLTTTISGASATTGTATGSVSVAAGDLITLKVTPSGTPTAVAIEAWVQFFPTTTDNFTYPGGFGSNNISSGLGVLRSGLLHGCMTPQTSDSHVNRSLAPFAGQITSLYVSIETAPSSTNAWNFIIERNGSEEASSAVSISGANKVVNVTGLTINVSAGDYLVFKLKSVTGTPTSTSGMNFAVTFVPTTAGYFALCGSTNAGSSQVATRFGGPTGAASAGSSVTGWNATEATVARTAPSALTTVGMAVRMASSPGGSDGWSYKSRNNVADGNLAIAFTGATVAGTDTSHTDSITSGNTFAIKVANTGIPNGMSDNCWAMGFTGPSGPSGSAGTGSASFPHLTAQGTGSQSLTATGAAALPHITVQGSGSELQPTGTSANLFPHFFAQGFGITPPVGTGAIALPNFEAASPDARAHGGHGGGQHFIAHSRDIAFPHFRAQGSGSLILANAGAITLPHVTVQGSGIRNTNGLGVITFPHFISLGGQGAQNPKGSGAVAFPHFMAQGGTAIGIGVIAFPSFDAQGYSESPIGIGIGAIALPAFLVQGRQVFISPVIILTPRGPKLATAYIHSPWYPRHRMATLSTWSNGDRSFTAVSRLGSKDTGQGAGHISNRDPSLLRDSGILTHGNLLVITSPVAQPWVGVLVTTNEDDSTGQIELSAISYEAVLDGRITPQGQKYTASVGANAVFDSLIAEANARNHTGLLQPTIVEMSNPVEDLEIGGQSVLEALNELCGRTDSEWWLDYQVTPQYINATVRLGFMQGLDLSSSRHYYQGTHFTSQFKQDMSQVKQSVTAVGDFGADLPDRNSVTMVGSEGPQHLGIQTAAIHIAGVTTARRLAALPAGLRNEKIVFEVPTGNTGELSRRAGLVQERPLQAERSFQVTFYNNVDFRDVQAGNIVSLWGKWGGVSGQHVVRIMGSQPDEETGSCVAAVWELVQ